jgi:hypothetical protein
MCPVRRICFQFCFLISILDSRYGTCTIEEILRALNSITSILFLVNHYEKW